MDFPFRRMRDELSQFFDEFSNTFSQWEPSGAGWNWGLNVEDKQDHMEIHAEAPGFSPEDFDVRVIGDRLILQASRHADHKKNGGEVHEQFECYETVMLPHGVDASKVDASYHNGMLTVNVPKTKEALGQRIAVKAGESTSNQASSDQSPSENAAAEPAPAEPAAAGV